jgi:hypothetical protein
MGLRPDLEQRRLELIEHLFAEFKDVSRAGGVSWTQTFVMDDYGSDEEVARAANEDTDTNWIDLARGDAWFLGIPETPWSFLDPVGTRYYIAAAMLLDLERGTTTGHEYLLSRGPRDDRLDLLTHDQFCVVAMYMRWKREYAAVAEDIWAETVFTDALAAGWDAYPPLSGRE